jgi:hypothetical protein
LRSLASSSDLLVLVSLLLRAGSFVPRVRSKRYLGVIWKRKDVSISTHLLPQPEKYGLLRGSRGVSSPNLGER